MNNNANKTKKTDLSVLEDKTAVKHFCTCPVSRCPRHPSNHNKGCDPCIKDNIEKRKMPACMFKAVSDDVSGVSDFTIAGFVDFYLKCQAEPENENSKA